MTRIFSMSFNCESGGCQIKMDDANRGALVMKQVRLLVADAKMMLDTLRMALYRRLPPCIAALLASPCLAARANGKIKSVKDAATPK